MPVQSLCMGIFYAVSLLNRLYGSLYRSDNLAEIYTKTTVDKDSSSKSGSNDLKVSTIDLKGDSNLMELPMQYDYELIKKGYRVALGQG